VKPVSSERIGSAPIHDAGRHAARESSRLRTARRLPFNEGIFTAPLLCGSWSRGGSPMTGLPNTFSPNHAIEARVTLAHRLR
jgi:hypothetical protein